MQPTTTATPHHPQTRPTPRAAWLAIAACLSLGACVTSEPDEVSEPDEPEALVTQRGQRICELFELIIIDDHLGLDVWNNGNFHDCPDDYLAAVDRDRFAVGGPRWRSVDVLESVDADGQPLDFDPQIAQVPEGLGYDMFWAAQVALVPLADLEATLGITIESLEDVPPMVQQMVRSNAVAGQSYEAVEVHRSTATRMVHHAGREVFVLDDGQCRYAMKFYTSVVDPTLTNEDAVAQLGDRFELLPDGWSFEVRTFDEDLVIRDEGGVARVIADEFGNSYDRYECD